MTDELGACTAYVCTKQCQQYEPGRKLGRDTWASCANCTHSPQMHKPRAATAERKRKP